MEVRLERANRAASVFLRWLVVWFICQNIIYLYNCVLFPKGVPYGLSSQDYAVVEEVIEENLIPYHDSPELNDLRSAISDELSAEFETVHTATTSQEFHSLISNKPEKEEVPIQTTITAVQELQSLFSDQLATCKKDEAPIPIALEEKWSTSQGTSSLSSYQEEPQASTSIELGEEKPSASQGLGSILLASDATETSALEELQFFSSDQQEGDISSKDEAPSNTTSDEVEAPASEEQSPTGRISGQSTSTFGSGLSEEFTRSYLGIVLRELLTYEGKAFRESLVYILPVVRLMLSFAAYKRVISPVLVRIFEYSSNRRSSSSVNFTLKPSRILIFSFLAVVFFPLIVYLLVFVGVVNHETLKETFQPLNRFLESFRNGSQEVFSYHQRNPILYNSSRQLLYVSLKEWWEYVLSLPENLYLSFKSTAGEFGGYTKSLFISIIEDIYSEFGPSVDHILDVKYQRSRHPPVNHNG